MVVYKFSSIRLAILSASVLALASCNMTGNPVASLEQKPDPVALSQNDPVRKATMQRLAVKLEAQKRNRQAKISVMKKLAIKLKTQMRARQAQISETENSVIIANLRPANSLDLDRLTTRKTIGQPTVMEKNDPSDEQTDLASIPRLRPITNGAGNNRNGPLGRFHAKLAALKSGHRVKPITILHIGDSHIASDSFSRGIRTALQKEYGNSGRGMVIPAGAYKYGVADQISLKTTGNWRGVSALRQKRGRFGISGVSVTSRSSKSSMKLVSKTGSFDWAEVTVATGPSQGEFAMIVGGAKKRFEAFAKKKGSKVFRIDARGRSLILIPGGGAQTTVLNWATGKNSPGIRYVNFGLIGATLNITNRFNMKLVANDVRHLDPDLIIYGYGTNEGFNDGLRLAAYRKQASRYMNKLKASAPNADIVYMGASSGLRRKGNRACGGWSTPPKLEPLRASIRKLAANEDAAYWDWSAAMGGVCSINSWAGRGLAAKDRVHLTSKGYAKSAKAFAKWLVTPAKSNVAMALN